MEIKKEIKRKGYAVRLAAEEDGKEVGHAYVYIIFQDRHVEPYAYLENVYVEKEHRSHGVGTKLITQAIAEAKERGCYKIIGTSKAHKTEVHAWYERHGFTKVGVEFRMDLIEGSKVITKD